MVGLDVVLGSFGEQPLSLLLDTRLNPIPNPLVLLHYHPETYCSGKCNMWFLKESKKN